MKKNILVGFLAVAAMSATAGCSSREASLGDGSLESLTGSSFTGKKYYFGWGEVLDGSMGNETKYDVKHTHDIFASGQGGNYISTTLVDKQFSGSNIKSAWKDIGSKMTAQDMFVQYSSGHGYEQGLGVGVEYSEIIDNALKMPSKEVVIFIMACHSGGLVNELNSRKAEWANWKEQGKSIFVMSSSTVDENSSTGPGTDSQENGPDGSAGSAFGHALWKTLIGESDGSTDGVRDGFISLNEIVAQTTVKTQEIGGHTPTYGGTFNPYLIMNQVPNPSAVNNNDN